MPHPVFAIGTSFSSTLSFGSILPEVLAVPSCSRSRFPPHRPYLLYSPAGEYIPDRLIEREHLLIQFRYHLRTFTQIPADIFRSISLEFIIDLMLQTCPENPWRSSGSGFLLSCPLHCLTERSEPTRAYGNSYNHSLRVLYVIFDRKHLEIALISDHLG